MKLLAWLRWSRHQQRPKGRPRLTLEHLESREVPAGIFTWDPDGPDQSWSNPANWSVSGTTNTIPQGDGTETLVFNNLANQISNPARLTTANDISTGNSYQTIIFTADSGGGFTLEGGSLTIGAGGIVDNTPASGAGQSNKITVPTVAILTNNALNATTVTAHLDLSGTTLSLNNQVVTLAGQGAVTLGAVTRGGNTGQINSQVATAAVLGTISGGTGGTAVNVGATSTLTLAGVNTYVGAITVQGGTTLIVNSSQPFGTDPANAVLFSAGGTLRNGNGSIIDLTTNVFTSSGQWNIDGPGGGSITFHRGIQKNLPGDTPSAVNLTGSTFLVKMQNDVGQAANDIGDVTVGTGVTLQLAFADSLARLAIPGNLTINGTVTMLERGNQINTTSNVTLNSGGVFNLNGFSNTIASLTGGGQVQLATPGALTVNNAAADLFSGTFTGNGGLNKTSGGTLTLTGNSASFTGLNHVQQGTEIVDGVLAGPVNVSSATLSGIGTVGPLTTLSGTNAIVDPGALGNTTTGILLSGATTFDSSATFRVLLNSASGNTSPMAGIDYDQLMANGAVNLNGAKLQVDLGTSFGGAIGRSFTILTGTSVTGPFAGFPNPTPMMNPPLLHVGSSFFVVRYTATSVILDEVAAPTTTMLTINYSSQPNPARFGETITFTAQVNVAATGGGSASGGTVTFRNGADTLGTATVNASGQAVFTVNSSNPLAVGTYSQIVAVYSGTSSFQPSQSSPPQNLTVIKADTTTSLSPPSSTISFGQMGSVVATVSAVAPGAGTPTGNVQFTITGPANSTQTVSLSGATASPDLSALLPGTYSITAQYLGDSGFNTSLVSNTVQVTVQKVDLGIALAPTSVAFAAPFNFQVTLTGPAALNAVPTGTVTIKEGATVLATITSFTGSNGTYTSMVAYAGPNLTPGTHNLTIEYDGSADPNYNTVSTSATLDVGKADLSLSIAPTSVDFDTPFTFIVTLTGPAALPLPTGSLTILVDGNPLPATNVFTGSNGVYTAMVAYTGPTLNIGPHSVVANYDGSADSNYNDATANSSLEVRNRELQVRYIKPQRIIRHGSTVVFTIAVENVGDGQSKGAFLLQKLPAFTRFNARRSTPKWVHQGKRVFRLDLGTIPAGAVREVRFAITVSPRAPRNRVVFNRVWVRDVLSPDANLAAALARSTIIPRWLRWPSF